MQVTFTPRAVRQVLEATRWWRTHRDAVPFLIDDELAEAIDRIAAHPAIGLAVPERAGVRRLLLRRCEHHLYYRVRPRARRVEVLAFWYAGRGSSPP